MNDLENYKAVLEQYFGSGTATFDTTSGATNSVTGALNHTGFALFHSTFFSRLKRLAARYSNTDSSKKQLLEMLNRVASRIASGWFAVGSYLGGKRPNESLDASAVLALAASEECLTPSLKNPIVWRTNG